MIANHLYQAVTTVAQATLVGVYFMDKYRTRILSAQHEGKESPYFSVAKQLRKQGVPLDIARVILLGKH